MKMSIALTVCDLMGSYKEEECVPYCACRCYSEECHLTCCICPFAEVEKKNIWQGISIFLMIAYTFPLICLKIQKILTKKYYFQYFVRTWLKAIITQKTQWTCGGSVNGQRKARLMSQGKPLQTHRPHTWMFVWTSPRSDELPYWPWTARDKIQWGRKNRREESIKKLKSMKLFIETGKGEQEMMRDGCIDGYIFSTTRRGESWWEVKEEVKNT